MPREVQVDISPAVGAVVGVLLEPYMAFLEKLVAEGRITAAELEAVHAERRSLIPRLGELVQALLRDQQQR
jgi:hypothetical protein